jgi:hypothetical protein
VRRSTNFPADQPCKETISVLAGQSGSFPELVELSALASVYGILAPVEAAILSGWFTRGPVLPWIPQSFGSAHAIGADRSSMSQKPAKLGSEEG